jgi:hypothetical protein
MGLIADILGGLRPGGKPRTIAQVEAALAKLAAKRADARGVVTKSMQEREALLLVDDSEKQIAQLDAAADKARLVIERMERAEPLLISELQSLKTEARRKRWRDLREQYEAASRDYADALRDAIDKQAAMVALGDTARREGFEQEAVACFTPPMRMLTADGLNEFEVALDRQRDAQVAERAAAPAPLVTPGKTTPKPAPKLAAVPLVKPKPRAPIVETPAEGQIAVVVVKGGIEVAGRPPLATGDVIALPPVEAEKLLRSGSVDRHQPSAPSQGAA